MNRLLLLMVSLLPYTVALAQPDPEARGMGINPPEAQIQPGTVANTPENGVRKFIGDLNGNLDLMLPQNVSGARVGFYGAEELDALFNSTYFFSRVKNLKIDLIKVENQTDTEATVSVTTHQDRRNGGEVRRTEPETTVLQLRREVGIPAPGLLFLKNAWRIVPPPIEDVLAKSIYETPPLQLAAAMALRDPRLLSLLQQEAALSQLKQLGLGVAQFVQDYDELFVFDDAGHERALRPYLKDDKTYTIIGTKDEKWHFNDNLSTLSLAQINESAQTVLFYDGTAPQNDKLNFRFNNKTLIGFADGHCKAFSKDELSNLIWKP